MFERPLIRLSSLAIMLLAFAASAHAESALSLGLSSTSYGSEGAVPQIDLRYQKWTPDHLGLETGLSSMVYLNSFDLSVIYPIGDRVTLVPRVGPSLLISGDGGFGVVGLSTGFRLSAPSIIGSGIALDATFRMFGVGGSAVPVTAVGMSMVWGH
jgi:hypothetical protein